MSTDVVAAPARWGLSGPRIAREWLSTRERATWPDPPAGHGRPVMLIPGFLAGDASLTRMAAWLRGGGWAPVPSGINWNIDCLEPTVERLRVRLCDAVEEHGRPALIVGQSRGGAVGRALTVLYPELVDTLVTLGSPLTDQLAIRSRTWASVGAVGLLGTAGMPGMFSLRCLRGRCCAQTTAALTAPFPAGVGFCSLYSRSDEIVRWRACLDPAATHVEVDTSHIGMAFDRRVWTAVAAAL